MQAKSPSFTRLGERNKASVVIVCTLFDVFAGVLNQSYREARAPRFSGVVFVGKSSKS